jgi:integrase/recombinase XerD
MASFEDIRRFRLHVAQSGVGTGALNATVTALRFFFRVTLKRYAIVEHTAFVHEPRKLPVVLSPEEIARFLDAAPGLKYKAALSVAYGSGLCASRRSVQARPPNGHRRQDAHDVFYSWTSS